jgi:hypothetical protein
VKAGCNLTSAQKTFFFGLFTNALAASMSHFTFMTLTANPIKEYVFFPFKILLN